MKILIGHNRYQFRGGEDGVVDAEIRMLRHHGHEVLLIEGSNDFFETGGVPQRAAAFKNLFWSKKSYLQCRQAIRKHKPDLAHFHNIFYSLTPSVYDACRDLSVPVVQSQHNFRLLCANGLFFRNGHVCEDCVEFGRMEGVKHACFRQSRLKTAVLSYMVFHHWQRRTWQDKIDRYIMAADFTKAKYAAHGIAEEKISVKPHFLYPEPESCPGPDGRQGGVLYVGRLSREKGVEVLLTAWKNCHDIPLKIMGTGPLEQELKKFVQQQKIENVEFLGFVNDETYHRHMCQAQLVVIPSQCYENFPRIIAESYAYGIPVVASRLGSLIELVKEGHSGILFQAEDPEDLSSKVRQLMSRPEILATMSKNARELYQQNFSMEVNYKILTGIYERTISNYQKK
ncbi:MAG: glycosyltransferase [Candidatus Omnitrophica bacterium]|nr:glycosyltransferase [Candidatus Omnitrophota bacterium]